MANVFWVIDGKSLDTIKGEVTKTQAIRYMVDRIGKKDGPSDLLLCDDDEKVTVHAFFEPDPNDGPTVVIHYIDPVPMENVEGRGIVALDGANLIDAEYFDADAR